MIGKIRKIISDWYKGDNGNPKYNPITEKYVYERVPKRSKIAIFLNKAINLVVAIFLFFKKDWRVLIPIFFTALSFIYTYSINQTNKQRNKEYKRCEIQAETKSSITLYCIK